jgi:hypothetical protein
VQAIMQQPVVEGKKLAIDWSETESFRVWLHLAERNYQDDHLAEQHPSSWVGEAAAA